ncbi:MAG: cyclic pyranopterin monophosphate synthase accessory protein [Nitrospinota bacterium]|nr:MAG: cyclic pyranopterin monophosphate synthase accessory protein [Nitrospinota bacterium]
MVDVSEKGITSRKAVATGKIYLEPETLRLINEGQIKKRGCSCCRAGCRNHGCKKIHEIIPMCHPLFLTGIDISFDKHQEPDPKTGLCSITITGTVKVTGQTGVEMEALTAVSTAALTIYDMCKAVDRGMYFDKIGLIHKSGGKSGTFEKEGVGE